MKETSKRSAGSKSHPAIFPPFIKRGDTIGLFAPAGSIINTDNFTSGINILEKKGFRIKFNRRLLYAKGYLAGADQERADEFNRLWSDPEVKALVAARGGYGSMRMLDLIDMKQIRKNPKILVGFSDLTVLLGAVHNKTKVVVYHGPVITTLASIDRQSQESFFNMLTAGTPPCLKPGKLQILKGGRAKGTLLGGNLTTLAHTIGTPYEIPWQNAILFIEDIGESAYRLDRLLTHLSKAGRLQKIKGLLLGTFSDQDRKENGVMRKAVQKRVAELLDGVNIPVWSNFPVGHGRGNLTLPVGLQVEMDSAARSLLFQN